jgi:hypothetical protein
MLDILLRDIRVFVLRRWLTPLARIQWARTCRALHDEDPTPFVAHHWCATWFTEDWVHLQPPIRPVLMAFAEARLHAIQPPSDGYNLSCYGGYSIALSWRVRDRTWPLRIIFYYSAAAVQLYVDYVDEWHCYREETVASFDALVAHPYVGQLLLPFIH